MTPEERAGVRNGTLTLSAVHNGHRATSPDQTIDRVIDKFGAARVARRALGQLSIAAE
jgi:hypothetical protein